MVPKYCINCISTFEDDTSLLYPKNTISNNRNIGNISTAPVQPNQQLNQSNDSNFEVAPGSPIILGPEYTQGYLRTLIGKKILVEFLIGTEGSTDRSGILENVGASYIILRETETGNRILCDIYSIKFVTIFE